MKIISTEWKTFFVEEKNFLLKTDKAYFIQLPNKAGSLEGLWISTKFAKYNEVSKKGTPIYSFSIKKDLMYKVVNFQFKENGDFKVLKNTTREIKGEALIAYLFAQLKNSEGDQLKNSEGVDQLFYVKTKQD